MYEEKIFVTSNDVDEHYKTKLSAIFKYLQQVSTDHAELIGLGKKDTVEKGMFWVITRMKVVIHKLPEMLETLTVTTHPGDLMLFVFPRFYEVYNEKGELVISASSSWVLLDSNTHKLVTKPPVDYSLYIPEKSRDDIPIPEKINFEDIEKIETRKVRYSDIDLNSHLNNTKYIEYITDIHNTDFYRENYFKEIVINYEKEVMDNQEVELFSNNQIPEIVVGKVNGNTCFTAKITYSKR